MYRYLTPVLFAAAGLYVRHHNTTRGDSQLLLPFLDAVPGYQDLFAQGQLTWQILLGIGGVLLAFAAIGHVRAWRNDPARLPDEG